MAIIGSAYCEIDKCTWVLYSDGSAYATTGNRNPCARNPNGDWGVAASKNLEDLYVKYLNWLILPNGKQHHHPWCTTLESTVDPH